MAVSQVWSGAVRVLFALWRRVQVSHRGKFSVERLQALDDYSSQTSLVRVMLLCALTPVPALVLVVALECLPLRDPSEGWRANYVLWIRYAAMGFSIALALVFQVKHVIPGLEFTVLRSVAVALGTSGLHIALMVYVSSTWVFPIPFGIVVSVVPYVLFFVCCFLLAVGREPFRVIPDLMLQLQRQIYIIVAQAALVLIYPTFSAVFIALPPSRQSASVLLLPVMKIVMKNIVAWAASHLEEYLPEIVVFSVEVFNVLYVATCMQTAGSSTTSFLIIAFDVATAIQSLRSINHRTAIVQSLREQSSSKLGLLSSVLEICQQPEVLLVEKSAVIRLRSPIQHILSVRNQKLLEGFEHQQRAMGHTPDVSRTIANPRRIELVDKTLALLFHCEYLVLVEYIECTIPVLYATYLSVLFYLPNATYYPHTHTMTESRLHETVVNLLVYACLEMLSLVAMHFVLKKKFGFSPVHLLAFVLETQMQSLQGRLFMWIVYILQFTLQHFGVDFTFTFAWMHARPG